MLRPTRPSRTFAATRALAALIVLVPAGRMPDGPLRLFLDCQNTFCDADFLRTEVAFVDYVRDRTDADVHALVTTQANGAGGQTYTVRFIGQGRLAGKADELTFATRADDTDDARRRALAKTLAAGLLPFVARVDGLDRVRVTSNAAAADSSASAVPAIPARDPWNRWVFSLSARGNFNGDKRYSSRFLSYNVSARRVTERWKTRFTTYANTSRNAFVLPGGAEDVSEQTRVGASGLGAYALGPRLSAGLEGSAFHSTFDNTDLAVRVAPGVEINAFPYSESTRRSLTARYSVGAQHVDYRDSTLYNKLREVLVDQSLVLGVDLRQPWGSVGLSGTALQYLNHPKQYTLGLFGNANVRLFRGLSADFFGNVSFLRNQRQISRAGETDADVYTRRRALESGYNYFAGVGLRYTFGSIFTGVVNPRFGGDGGGGIVFFN